MTIFFIGLSAGFILGLAAGAFAFSSDTDVSKCVHDYKHQDDFVRRIGGVVISQEFKCTHCGKIKRISVE